MRDGPRRGDAEVTRALTMLNQAGDTTIIWDEEQDEAMAKIVVKKMEEGCAFYIIEPRMGGLAAPKRTRLANFDDALAHRALSIPDADLRAFVGMGAGEVVKTPSSAAKKGRRSKVAAEIAASESIGVAPRRGG